MKEKYLVITIIVVLFFSVLLWKLNDFDSDYEFTDDSGGGMSYMPPGEGNYYYGGGGGTIGSNFGSNYGAGSSNPPPAGINLSVYKFDGITNSFADIGSYGGSIPAGEIPRDLPGEEVSDSSGSNYGFEVAVSILLNPKEAYISTIGSNLNEIDNNLKNNILICDSGVTIAATSDKNNLKKDTNLCIKINGELIKIAWIGVKNVHGKYFMSINNIPYTWLVLFSSIAVQNPETEIGLNELFLSQSYNLGISPTEIGKYTVDGKYLAYVWLIENNFPIDSDPNKFISEKGKIIGDLFIDYCRQNVNRCANWKVVEVKSPTTTTLSPETTQKSQLSNSNLLPPLTEELIKISNAEESQSQAILNTIANKILNILNIGVSVRRIVNDPPSAYVSIPSLGSATIKVIGEVAVTSGSLLIQPGILQPVAGIKIITTSDDIFPFVVLLATKNGSKRETIALKLTADDVNNLSTLAQNTPIIGAIEYAFSQMKYLPKSAEDLLAASKAQKKSSGGIARIAQFGRLSVNIEEPPIHVTRIITIDGQVESCRNNFDLQTLDC